MRAPHYAYGWFIFGLALLCIAVPLGAFIGAVCYASFN